MTSLALQTIAARVRAAPPSRCEAWWRWTPWLIIALAVALRLARYLAHRSLWLDEAMLSCNITARFFADLTEPLEYNQGAPIGFLMLEKIAVTLFGNNEYALRLVPLLAGCAAVALFHFLARRTLDRPLALLGLALFALSEPLIYYSSEVKQYSSDVAATVLVFLLTLRVMQRQSRGLETLAIAGALLLWFSHAVTFILAGAATALVLPPLAARRYRAASLAAAVAALWLTSFLAHYFLSLRNLTANPYLLNYWKYDFLPFPPRTLNDLLWYPMAVVRAVRDPLENHALPPDAVKLLGAFAAGILLLGLVRLFRHERTTALPLLLPLAFLVAASALQRYPLRGRLILFLSPLILLLLMQGLRYVHETFRHGRWLARGFAAALLLPLTLSAAAALLHPPPRDELRPVLQYIARHADRSDCLYLLAGSGPGTRFYVTNFPDCRPKNNRIIPGPWEIWIPKNQNLSELDEFRKVAPPQRVWIVFATTTVNYYARQEARAVRLFDAAAPRLDEIHAPGASAYLYDLTQPTR